jgi:hypothetical protein
MTCVSVFSRYIGPGVAAGKRRSGAGQCHGGEHEHAVGPLVTLAEAKLATLLNAHERGA